MKCMHVYRLSDLLSRRDRCECAPTQSGAEKCFWLEFDKETFVAASLKTEPELRRMFRERLVWDDPDLNADLISKGLLSRVHTPSVRPPPRLFTLRCRFTRRGRSPPAPSSVPTLAQLGPLNIVGCTLVSVTVVHDASTGIHPAESAVTLS